MASSDRPVIVVGVDGSPASVRALRWAADQARQSGAVVQVVTGYSIPPTIYISPTYTEADYANDARRMLDRSVIEALGAEPDIHVEKHLIDKPPKRALVDAARGAKFLVVGGQGQGEVFGELHLGSVASYVVHHAPCTVVVVRGEAAD